ncbi:GbsR/MarR family transcriptional regulator [Kitasatospora sp. SUK 42]|uniref:GbsR/MarR family transcriptional regulator n=1 Tax=Kitasatospora sp. SUK 42 TaxID=1588882 RepID=UPI0018C92FD3|nr:helix-turn-helix domain-containing protein [Kitasatospora sp. SUK 42]MBV2156661.1 helix-turn-helix domain-containing protein [Kitasatospora sp. SUK 42]
MPGARLTQEERRLIAAGLTAGLGYGEIARRLARPASTVTREIARNGGPSGYRADNAQRATVRRSRRSRTAQPRVPEGSATTGDGRDPAAVEEYATQLAELLARLGMPRMVGRVLACLYVTDCGSLTAAELVQRLGVSPASVSKAIGYLEGQELVRRERDDSAHRERYVVDDDIWYRALLAGAQRNTLLAEFARSGADLLGTATPAGARMAEASVFLEHMGTDIVHAAQRRRRQRAGEPAPTGSETQVQ